MSITKNPPNTIYLGGGMGPGGMGGVTIVNDLVALAAITPGHLIELANSSGTPKWQKHGTANNPAEPTFALEQDFLNKTVDDDYAAGDLVVAGTMKSGSLVWAWVPSGANLNPGDRLQSNGDGTLKAFGAGSHIATALEGTGGAITVATRLRVVVK